MIVGAELAVASHRDRGANYRSAPRSRVDRERAADRLGTLMHPSKTEPRRPYPRVKALTVVRDEMATGFDRLLLRDFIFSLGQILGSSGR